MQFKTLITLASVAAVAVALPAAESAEATTPLTTQVTTNTFTASKVLESFMLKEPWITTVSTHTVWTVTHTVTKALPTETPA
ncbi:hypothetical protein BD413DRAFT_613159 [Trametes elegans]|nr:hypothetical protein BD413DRAFT_613159 [Trametes elegans]